MNECVCTQFSSITHYPTIQLSQTYQRCLTLAGLANIDCNRLRVFGSLTPLNLKIIADWVSFIIIIVVVMWSPSWPNHRLLRMVAISYAMSIKWHNLYNHIPASVMKWCEEDSSTRLFSLKHKVHENTITMRNRTMIRNTMIGLTKTKGEGRAIYTLRTNCRLETGEVRRRN